MDLVCYTYEGWRPRIRPASSKREWMDQAPESFAYRCLPLAIANSHGWEILSPCGFEARWTGGEGVEAVEIRLDPGVEPHRAAVSIFGQATVTFHIEGLFRTPPGWNLWVGGSPNHAKDGIAPLGGVIETDWSPYTFTMNWRFTRANHWVRFEENEPICFFFPIQRAVLLETQPRIAPIEDAPELKVQFEKWSASRNAFQEHVRLNPPQAPSDKWQKLYYRGVDPEGKAGVGDHQSKLRTPPFIGKDGAKLETGEMRKCPVRHAEAPPPEAPAPQSGNDTDLRKREWILEAMHRQRSLSQRTSCITRRRGLTADEFLEEHYAPGWPVILEGEMEDWPARRLWTEDYLIAKLGSTALDLAKSPTIDPSILTQMEGELGLLDNLLMRDPERPNTSMLIEPIGAFTPLRHDVVNSLLAQVQGARRILLAPPSESPRLYNSHEVFSEVGDLTDPEALQRFPLAAGVQTFEVDLEAGEILYLPVGWWHQVAALDFSVSISYTNFKWPNAAHENFPAA